MLSALPPLRMMMKRHLWLDLAFHHPLVEWGTSQATNLSGPTQCAGSKTAFRDRPCAAVEIEAPVQLAGLSSQSLPLTGVVSNPNEYLVSGSGHDRRRMRGVWGALGLLSCPATPYFQCIG